MQAKLSLTENVTAYLNNCMNTLSRFSVAFALALCLATTTARAEDKNGLSVTVSKTTLDKRDSRSTYYERTNKTQALKVSVKNISFKPMPEGEMTWKILVVGSYSSTLYSGVEKVNALKPAESHDLIIGAAEVSAWKDYSGRGGDKTEHQITIKHGDKEIIKTQTNPGFDAMAKRASPAGSGSSSSGSK